MLSIIINYLLLLPVTLMTGDTGPAYSTHTRGGGTDAEVRTYRPAGDSYVMVRGTSTLHDWEMVSDDINGEIRLILNGNGIPGEVEDLLFSMGKTTLKSNQSGLDRRAYDAMNAKRNPEITFRMNGTGQVRHAGDGLNISTEGFLSVAGETRKVNVEATCINGEDNMLICTGSHTLRMSDFSIDPPVMMLGALRTANEVTVDYRIVFSQ